MEAVQQLQQLGFSQYEAQAYVTLLQKSPLNGYELAKESGIPRANIYTVLQRLEETGAVMRLATSDTVRYSPVAVDELLAKLKRRHQLSLEAVSTSLRDIASPPMHELILNFKGYSELLNQARALLDHTEQQMLLSIWPEEAVALAEPVQNAIDRGVKITTLCLRGCPQPCPACRGAVHRYAIAPEDGSRWLVLVSDEKELLAGEIQVGNLAQDSTGSVRTRQPMLVHLTGSYIQNSIALATIMTSLGNRLISELDSSDITALNDLQSLPAGSGWLESMQRMLNLDRSDS